MADSIDQLRESFVEETKDLINELEDILLSLETDQVASELIDQIFRSIHTIKGSGGMLGFEKVLAVTHDLEDIYDRVRGGELEFSSELKEISLETIDILKVLLSSNEQIDSNEQIRFADLCRKIHLFDVILSEKVDETRPETLSAEIIQRPYITYWISFSPGNVLPAGLLHPKFLFRELMLMGNGLVFVKSGSSISVNAIEEADKKASWLMILSTREEKAVIEDVFEWVGDSSALSIRELIRGNLLAVPEAKAELEKKKGKIVEYDFDDIIGLIDPYVDKIVQETVEEHKKEKSADDGPGANGGVIKSIRVATEKVDQLMNLVSEMVTLQARLNLISEQMGDPDLQAVAEKYGSFSKQLRDNAFTISLVPFGITITRYKRMVHDLSEKLYKKIDFITEGEETVLDKKIIEQLSDPIMHILRNSIDHGIEPPDERRELGKPETGKITMKIYHQSNNVIIKIIDDGRGINIREIERIAIKKKLLDKNHTYSDYEILNMIFLPGFSSAKKVSNVSGRGVGLDVVKRNISEIRGAIDIDTEVGKNTTFTIRLPLTLSIIDGLQVHINERNFIIPLNQVSKIYTLDKLERPSDLSQMMILEGDQIPYFDLRDDFELGGTPPERREVVLVGYDQEKVALIVDSVIGENQTVLKSLGSHFKNQDFISGGTILGDGSVALVLDVNKIVTVFSKNKK
ncbi:MAG TPA: chemotaxis protein CheA [Prolixibacteraceae bacterium]|nr:chemotaxis protein CheA [Prolixibacteraceae bacterium]